jgi:hypothetical protein
MGSGFRAAAAQRFTHIALGPVGLGQRRRQGPLGDIFGAQDRTARRPGGLKNTKVRVGEFQILYCHDSCKIKAHESRQSNSLQLSVLSHFMPGYGA